MREETGDGDFFGWPYRNQTVIVMSGCIWNTVIALVHPPRFYAFEKELIISGECARVLLAHGTDAMWYAWGLHSPRQKFRRGPPCRRRKILGCPT